MSDPHATTDCRLIGDYVDDGASPDQPACHQRGEVIRPQALYEYLDSWATHDGLRRFTVLMKDGRVAVIRGHSLKPSPHAVPGEDVYSIALRTNGEETTVALFKSAQVTGIFHGEIRADGTNP